MNRFFFIIISFLLIYDIASSSNKTDSKINNPHNLSRIHTNHIQLKKDETITYNYKSLKNTLNQTKLRVVANPSKESDSGDLDLELLLNDKVIGSCKQLLKDSCFFDLSNKAKTYQMKFTCKNEDCLIGVIITEAREIRIEPSQTHFFRFAKTKSEIFNISIPKKDNFDRIVITLGCDYRHIGNYSFNPQLKCDPNLNEDCIMYGLSDKLIFEIRNTAKLPFEDQLSLEIQTVTMSSKILFQIEYNYYTDITELQLNNRVLDIIDNRLFHAYMVKISKSDIENKRIHFHLRNYFGGVKSISIVSEKNLKELIKNSSLINSFVDGGKEFRVEDVEYGAIIDPEVLRRNVNSEDVLFFIVYKNAGSFSIELSARIEKIIPLRLGISERHKLEINQCVNYELLFPKGDVTTTVDVNFEIGAADVYVKECTEIQCPIMNSLSIQEKISQYEKYLNSNSHKLIKIPSNCEHPTIYDQCRYSLVFCENSKISRKSKIHITARQGGNTIIDLQENHPISISLHPNVWVFYKLWLTPEKSLKEVIFSISAHDVDFYLSNDPNCLKDSKCGNSQKGDVDHAISDTVVQNELNIYYVSIRATKTTKTIFYAEVIRTDSPTIISLFDGVPMTGELNQERPGQMYVFEVDFHKEKTISLNLNANYDILEMYVSKSKTLKFDDGASKKVIFSKVQWISKDGVIKIATTHKSYKKKAIYYVWVTYKGDLNKSLKNEPETRYQIMFSSEHNYKTLQNNVPFYDKIEPEEVKTFRFFVNPNKEEIILHKFLMRSSMNTVMNQKELGMIVSTTPFGDLSLSNIANITKLFDDEDSNSYFFNKTILPKLCEKFGKVKSFCTLYISLKNKGVSEILYGLSVNIRGLPIEILDGVELSSSISDFGNENLLEKSFYFRVKNNNNTINIFSESDFGSQYLLSVKIMDHKETAHFKYTDLENKQSSIFHSGQDSLHSLTIEPKDLQLYCKNHCIILVSINVLMDPRLKSSYNYLKNELIYLLITSQTVYLQEGRHLIVHLNPQKKKYFFYSLENLMKTDDLDAIVISTTSLTGTFILNINEGNKTYSEFPERSRGTWWSTTGHVTIFKSELKSTKETVEPKLIIEVESKTGGKFIIDVIENNLISLSVDYPLQTYVNQGEEQAYEFVNYKYYEGFQVKFMREFGNGNISLYKIPEDKLIDEILFKNPVSFCTVDEQNKHCIITLESTHKEYCWGCIYYVVVHAETYLKGTISINTIGGTKNIHMNTLYFDAIDNETSIYNLDIPLYMEIEILLTVYHGFPQLEAAFGEYYTAPSVYDLEPDFSIGNYQKLIISQADLVEYLYEYKRKFNLTQKTTEGFFNTGHITLYIKVKSNTASNYSLEVYSSDSYRVLKEGVITYVQTNATEKSDFVYERNINDIISVKNRTKTNLLITRINGNLNLKIIFYYKMERNKREILELTPLSSSENSVEYELPEKYGIFNFQIENLNKISPVQYFIIVSSSDQLVTLPYESEMSVSIKNHKTRFFETYLPIKGVFTLELMECHGSVQLLRANSYKQLIKGNGLEQFEAIEGFDHLNVFRVKKPQPFFFSLKGETKKFTNVQLKLKMWDSISSIPHNILSIGSSGQIDYSVKGKNIHLKFLPISCPTCKPETLKTTFISYEILVGNTLFDVDSVGKCRLGVPKIVNNSLVAEEIHDFAENLTIFKISSMQLQKNSSKKLTYDLVHDFDENEKKKEKGIDHYLTVRAHITNYLYISNKTASRMLEPFDLFYKTIEINFKPDNSTDDEIIVQNKELSSSNLNYQKMLFIAIIVIAILICCVIVAFCVERRKKRNFMHFSLDKDKNKLVRLDESSHNLDIELESKEFAQFNKDLKRDNY